MLRENSVVESLGCVFDFSAASGRQSSSGYMRIELVEEGI